MRRRRRAAGAIAVLGCALVAASAPRAAPCPVPQDAAARAPGDAGDPPPAATTGAGRVGAAGLLPMARETDPVVVRVGDVELRTSDVFRELDLVVPGTSAEVVRQMVLSVITRAEAEQHGIDVPAVLVDEGVESAIAEHRTRFALEVDAEMPLEAFVEGRFGLSAQRYRDEVRGRVLGNLLLDRVVRFALGRIERDELQVMLVGEAALADEIAAKLAEGASFQTLARRHSEHPSAATGGLLPPVPVDAEIAIVEGRAGLEVGGVLGPAPFRWGGRDLLRFVRLVDRLAADERPWSEVRDEIERGLQERPLAPEELELFEARMLARYRVTRPPIAADGASSESGQAPAPGSAEQGTSSDQR